MEDNLARDLGLAYNEQQAYAYEQALPEVTPSPEIRRLPQEEAVPSGLSRLEKLAIFLLSVALFAVLILNVYSSVRVKGINQEYQDTNEQIAQTTIEIENLKQYSYELTRYDRVREIAQKFGLEMHEENIVNLLSKK